MNSRSTLVRDTTSRRSRLSAGTPGQAHKADSTDPQNLRGSSSSSSTFTQAVGTLLRLLTHSARSSDLP